MKPKIVISGGGTGGHIFPAIAIADELKARYPQAEFLFVGASNRMEMEKVPQHGYPIVGLWISGIQRKLTLDNLMFPFKLLSSLLKARKLLKKFQPHIVIGTGGFASGPTLKAAVKIGIPTLVQEQNSYAGVTNKWVGKEATRISVAYENMQRFFPKDKIRFTGNPVRKGILESKLTSSESKAKFGIAENTTCVLIIGGSLGAKRVNEIVHHFIQKHQDKQLSFIWQTGKFYYENYTSMQAANCKVMAFIQHMEEAYAAADIIISRAGAGSVSELCLVGKPVIFIPSPNVAEDHQTKNAQALVDKDAAICIKESEASEVFEETLVNLVSDKVLQKKLAMNCKALARPNATKDIVDEIEQIWNYNNK